METTKIFSSTLLCPKAFATADCTSNSFSFLQLIPMLFPVAKEPMAMITVPFNDATNSTTLSASSKPIGGSISNIQANNDAIPSTKVTITKTITPTIPAIDYQRPLGVIDKYVLLSELGQDHLYPVYLASSIFDCPEKDGSNLVVLKAIPVADYRGSFQNETNVFQLKYHKNLLNCTEVIKNVKFHFSSFPKKSAEGNRPTPSDEFYHILILKYHANGDFLELVKKRRLEERVARYYFGQILDAVEYLHSHGYCHRDLKIENILLDQNFNLVLTDFGHSVKYKDKDGEKIFIDKSSVTTPGICPPEFHQGQGYRGTQMDIFALGKLLLIFITGFNPFSNTKTTDQNYGMVLKGQWSIYWRLMKAWMKKRWIKVGNFSKDFKALIEMMLNPDPTKRPATIQEIRESSWFKKVKPASAEEVKMEMIRMKTQV